MREGALHALAEEVGHTLLETAVEELMKCDVVVD